MSTKNTPPGPIEAGFKTAHKARAARLGMLPRPAIRAPDTMVADLVAPLERAEKLAQKLEQAEKRVRKLELQNSVLNARIMALDPGPVNASRPTVRHIILARAKQAGLRYQDIIGASRTPRVVHMRQAAIHDARTLRPDLSYLVLARLFGNRDHSTLIYSVRRHQGRLDDGTAVARPPLVTP